MRHGTGRLPGTGGTTASFSNLWNDGGFFPPAPWGSLRIQIATFAFVGIELVGTTAAETKNPERNLPKAINSIPVRVMLFYVVALIAIISVTPWRQISADRSPFVVMFTLAGLGIAASAINFVVLTSAASSANSGIYSTSRMVYGLAQEGDAPTRFGRLTSRKVPVNALLLSGLFLLPGVVMVTMGDSIIEAFTLVTTISALLFMFVWSIILICYLVYRRRRPHLHEASTFRMPGGVVMCYVVLAFFAFLVWALTQKEDTLQALLVTPVWFVILGIAWAVLRHRRRQAGQPASRQAPGTAPALRRPHRMRGPQARHPRRSRSGSSARTARPLAAWGDGLYRPGRGAVVVWSRDGAAALPEPRFREGGGVSGAGGARVVRYLSRDAGRWNPSLNG
ncbi:amino acid permease [Streptomyces sp. INA 01156]